jgi:ABC-type nitrate/sulfonate/bicarbonate transport system substrate-binding protein
MLESHGASRILASFHDIIPNCIFAGLYFPDKYLAKNGDAVRKVLKGIQKSFDFIAENEKEAREFLPKYTQVDRDVCMICALREYGTPAEPLERIYQQQKLMLKYGYLEKKAAIEPMIDYRYLPKEFIQK